MLALFSKISYDKNITAFFILNFFLIGTSMNIKNAPENIVHGFYHYSIIVFIENNSIIFTLNYKMSWYSIKISGRTLQKLCNVIYFKKIY